MRRGWNSLKLVFISKNKDSVVKTDVPPSPSPVSIIFPWMTILKQILSQTFIIHSNFKWNLKLGNRQNLENEKKMKPRRDLDEYIFFVFHLYFLFDLDDLSISVWSSLLCYQIFFFFLIMCVSFCRVFFTQAFKSNGFSVHSHFLVTRLPENISRSRNPILLPLFSSSSFSYAMRIPSSDLLFR